MFRDEPSDAIKSFFLSLLYHFLFYVVRRNTCVSREDRMSPDPEARGFLSTYTDRISIVDRGIH